MLHEMASQALSVPEILSVVSSNGMEMEGRKASCVELLRGDPHLIKWQAEISALLKQTKCVPLFFEVPDVPVSPQCAPVCVFIVDTALYM